MFGMKPDDALEVMEHAGVVQRVFGQAEAENEATHRAALRRSQDAFDDATMGNITAMLAVRSSQQEKLKLQRQASEMQNERNDVVAAGWAAVQTIKALVHELSLHSGESESVISARANRLRTKHYDSIVDDYLCKGVLQKDYRKDPEYMNGRDWYVPS